MGGMFKDMELSVTETGFFGTWKLSHAHFTKSEYLFWMKLKCQIQLIVKKYKNPVFMAAPTKVEALLAWLLDCVSRLSLVMIILLEKMRCEYSATS